MVSLLSGMNGIIYVSFSRKWKRPQRFIYIGRISTLKSFTRRAIYKCPIDVIFPFHSLCLSVKMFAEDLSLLFKGFYPSFLILWKTLFYFTKHTTFRR